MGQSIEVAFRGPLFEGHPEQVVDAMLRDLQEATAERIQAAVLAGLHGSIRRDTGHYTGRITTEKRADTLVVTDRGVRYGPWLEGVSKRNTSTGFRGYHAFRRAAEQAAKDIDEIAKPIVERHLAALQ